MPAHAYNCTVSDANKARSVRDVACGEPLLLYTTPESLQRDQALQDAIKVGVEYRNRCPLCFCAAQ